MESMELSCRRSEALKVVEDVTKMSGKFLINKYQCDRLAGRVRATGDELKHMTAESVGSKSIDAGNNVSNVDYPAFDLLLTVLRKAKALLSKYTEVNASIPSVLIDRDNRKAFEEIHADLDTMNSQFLLEDFESPLESMRKAILAADADKDLEEMHDSLDRLARSDEPTQAAEVAALSKNLENVKIVVSEKAEGTSTSDRDLPSFLTIDPAAVEIGEPVRIPDKRSNHDPVEMDGWALVFFGTWLGCQCAVKVFKSQYKSWNKTELLKEASSLMKLHHPHVVQLIGFAQDEKQCLILMELMDTDLRHFMESRSGDGKRPFSRAEELDIISQIAQGMYYLHEQQYVHGELKCSNILVKQIGDHIDVKIADLRSSQKLGVWNSALFKEISTRRRRRWTAPEAEKYDELVEPTHAELKKTDVYSFGMVCYEVVTGKWPFHDIRDNALKTRVETGDLKQELPGELDEKLRGLIELCWERDPNERPTFEAICHQLEYIRSSQLPVTTKSSGKDYVQRLFRWIPAILGQFGHRQEKSDPPTNSTWGKTDDEDRSLQEESGFGGTTAVTLPEFVRIDPGNLKKMRPIGEGSFAKVYEATWLGCKFAVKTFKRIPPIEALQREVKFLNELRHPSIVRLMGLVVHSEQRCSIVMEFMGYSLRQLIESRLKRKREANLETHRVYVVPFDLHEAVFIITKIALGMAFLHSRGVIHRDLKADNVLAPKHPGSIDVKITDFGESLLIHSINSPKPSRGVGTGFFRAPELLPRPSAGTSEAVADPDDNLMKATDVYSFAMTSYEVLTGGVPLAGDVVKGGHQAKIEAVIAGLRPTLPDDLNPDLKQLIVECWNGEPGKRPTFSTICQKLEKIQQGLHQSSSS